MKYKQTFSALALSGFLAGCASEAVLGDKVNYADNNNYAGNNYASNDNSFENETIFSKKNIEEMVRNSVKLETSLTYAKGDEEWLLVSYCSGTVLCGDERNYVFTANHCISLERELEEAVAGVKSVEDKKTKINIKNKGADISVAIIKLNEEYDQALLILPDKKLPCYGKPLAEKVELGDVVGGYFFPTQGFKHDAGLLFKGHVSGVFEDAGVQGYSKYEYAKHPTLTVLEGNFDVGTSGMGIYVPNGEKMLLAGVNHIAFNYPKGRGGMETLEQMQNFFKDAPPDLKKRLLPQTTRK